MKSALWFGGLATLQAPLQEREPTARIALTAWGDLDGWGEWTITPRGPLIEARYHCPVRADNPLIRHLSILAQAGVLGEPSVDDGQG